MSVTSEVDALMMSVRDGDWGSVLVLADALEDAGRVDFAAAVRQVPQAVETMRHRIADADPQGELSLKWYARKSGDWYLNLRLHGRLHRLHKERPAPLVKMMLEQWNSFHPIIEAIARHLGMPRVAPLRLLRPGMALGDGNSLIIRPVSLNRDGCHLTEFPFAIAECHFFRRSGS